MWNFTKKEVYGSFFSPNYGKFFRIIILNNGERLLMKMCFKVNNTAATLSIYLLSKVSTKKSSILQIIHTKQ